MIDLTNGVSLAIKACNGRTPLAEALGIRRQAIHQWKKVPLERVLEVERVTGVSRHLLRPDFFEPPAKPRKRRAA